MRRSGLEGKRYLAGRIARIAAAALFTGAAFAGAADDWPQWGADPSHSGAARSDGQALSRILADYVYDPFVAAEVAESGGDLLAHYAVPLLDGADVYMAFKTGTYVSCQPPGSGVPFPCGFDAWDSQVWGVQKLTWKNGVLVAGWSFTTDWKPEPAALAGWEPVFLPVLAGHLEGCSGRKTDDRHSGHPDHARNRGAKENHGAE